MARGWLSGRDPADRAGALLIAIVVGAILAGCDSAPVSSDPGLATGDLSVAWQAQPFRVAQPILAAAIASCQTGGVPREARAVLADARGGDRLTVVFESPDRITTASCSTLRSRSGTWQSTGSSVSSDSQPETLPAADEVRLGMESEGDQTGAGAAIRSIAFGRVGGNVAGVQLIVAGHPIAATVGNGWFAAWWPSGDKVTQAVAIGADGRALPQPVPAIP